MNYTYTCHEVHIKSLHSAYCISLHIRCMSLKMKTLYKGCVFENEKLFMIAVFPHHRMSTVLENL